MGLIPHEGTLRWQVYFAVGNFLLKITSVSARRPAKTAKYTYHASL